MVRKSKRVVVETKEERKTMYKVLNSDMKSPYQGFETEVGVEYSCPDFDDSDKECSRGFYATEPEGLVYSYRKGRRVFEVEVWGREKRFNQYKWRFENQKLLREVLEAELRVLLEKESQKVGYNVLEMCFPINPLTDIQRDSDKVSDEEIKLLKRWSKVSASVWDSVWGSVRDSVGDSVWGSVGDSVWGSVGNSVWNSVRASVRDSVRAYISSLFPNIKKWKYVDHPEGENPFQSGVDLWRRGLVPSFNGKTWRLHAGTRAEVVYEWTPEKS